MVYLELGQAAGYIDSVEVVALPIRRRVCLYVEIAEEAEATRSASRFNDSRSGSGAEAGSRSLGKAELGDRSADGHWSPLASLNSNHFLRSLSATSTGPIARRRRQYQFRFAIQHAYLLFGLVVLSCIHLTSTLLGWLTFSEMLPLYFKFGVVRGSRHLWISACPSAKEKPAALL